MYHAFGRLVKAKCLNKSDNHKEEVAIMSADHCRALRWSVADPVFFLRLSVSV